MRRSEQREHIFKLLFMTQFNSENEMSDQVSMYFDTLGELEEKDQEAIQNKYQHILEHLDEIDQILNEYSRGWKTTRMNRVDLTASTGWSCYQRSSRTGKTFWRGRLRLFC